MVVYTFMKGLQINLFSDSLLQNQEESMMQVWERASVHIEAKEAIRSKKTNE